MTRLFLIYNKQNCLSTVNLVHGLYVSFATHRLFTSIKLVKYYRLEIKSVFGQ